MGLAPHPRPHLGPPSASPPGTGVMRGSQGRSRGWRVSTGSLGSCVSGPPAASWWPLSMSRRASSPWNGASGHQPFLGSMSEDTQRFNLDQAAAARPHRWGPTPQLRAAILERHTHPTPRCPAAVPTTVTARWPVLTARPQWLPWPAWPSPQPLLCGTRVTAWDPRAALGPWGSACLLCQSRRGQVNADRPGESRVVSDAGFLRCFKC